MRRSAWGEGLKPFVRSFAAMNASIGFAVHPPPVSVGRGARTGRNDQNSSLCTSAVGDAGLLALHSAPRSIHVRKRVDFRRGKACAIRRHRDFLVLAGDDFDQSTLTALARQNGRSAGHSAFQQRFAHVKPQTAFLRVGTVTLEAAFFENRADVALEVDGRGRSSVRATRIHCRKPMRSGRERRGTTAVRHARHALRTIRQVARCSHEHARSKALPIISRRIRPRVAATGVGRESSACRRQRERLHSGEQAHRQGCLPSRTGRA